jgi:DNA-binding IclR family transcriptional regulator
MNTADGHVHLTIGIIAIGLLLGTLAGPVSELQNLTTANMQDHAFWLDILSATIRGAAAAGLATGGVVAGALGIPMWQARAKGSTTSGG